MPYRTARTIGKRVVPSLAAASGSWALGEVTAARRGQIWPTAGDLYFSDVVLLLQDSSADQSLLGLTTVLNGSASFTTAASKFGSASFTSANDATGATHNLEVAGGSLGFGTGDFTVECWYMQTTNFTNNVSFFTAVNSGPGSNRLNFLILSTGRLYADIYGSALLQSSVLTWNFNQWYHCAISRQGTSLKIFRDGQTVASATNTTSFASDTYMRIATRNTGHYIDDLRVTKGTARYTAAFTPPTQPHPTS